MNKILMSIVIIIVLVGVAYYAFSNKGMYAGSGTPANTAPTSGAVSPGGNTVTISNFSFAPTTLTVKVGDTVTWTNTDSVGHSAIADGGTFDTGIIAQGQTGKTTFTKAGTFTYHCSVHPSMKATIVVE